MDPHSLRQIAWVFLMKFFRRWPFISGIYSQLTAQHLTMAPNMTILSVLKKGYLGSIHYKIKKLVTLFQIYNTVKPWKLLFIYQHLRLWLKGSVKLEKPSWNSVLININVLSYVLHIKNMQSTPCILYSCDSYTSHVFLNKAKVTGWT